MLYTPNTKKTLRLWFAAHKDQLDKGIIPYLAIFLLASSVFFRQFGSGDELWNYSFAKNIVYGLVPYKDFSMLQTPVSAYITASLMLLLGDGLIVYRVMGYILLASMMTVFYHLSKKITKSLFWSFLTMILTLCLFLPFYEYTYNYLSAFVLLLILELECDNTGDDVSKNILIGGLFGLLPLIKQSTGALLFMANVVIVLVYLSVYHAKVKAQVYRLMVSLLPAIIFAVYICYKGAFADFIEYAILGVKEFTHRTTFVDLVRTVPFYAIFVIFIVVMYVVIATKIVKKGINRFQLIGLIIGTTWMAIVYPLFDVPHLVCIFIVLSPVFLMFAEKKECNRNEKIIWITVALLVGWITSAVVIPTKEEIYYSKINNYEYVMISRKMEENVQTISTYLKDKLEEGYAVRIADDSAAAYKIPLDLYEKNWDMLLIGNIGLTTMEELLVSPKECLYLVYRYTEKSGKQNHFELIDYIKENYTKIEEVLYFDVYMEQK